MRSFYTHRPACFPAHNFQEWKVGTADGILQTYLVTSVAWEVPAWLLGRSYPSVIPRGHRIRFLRNTYTRHIMGEINVDPTGAIGVPMRHETYLKTAISNPH